MLTPMSPRAVAAVTYVGAKPRTELTPIRSSHEAGKSLIRDGVFKGNQSLFLAIAMEPQSSRSDSFPSSMVMYLLKLRLMRASTPLPQRRVVRPVRQASVV